MPTEAIEKVADNLLRAIRSEREGQHFYLMAAQTCQDSKGREVFEQLAAEELGHAEFLQMQYRSVQMDLSGANPIFSDQIRSRLKDAHFEMTALAVGAQLELDAQKYYLKMAAESEDIVINTFFTELADWEAGHYRALLTQQESLKEDYWSGSGFAPF